MWVLHLLPSGMLLYVVNTLLVLGTALTVLGFFVLNHLLLWIPPLANFYKSMQALGILFLVAGVYFKGGYDTEIVWRDKVADLEQKIVIAEQESKNASANIQKRVITEVKVIKENAKTIYVDKPVLVEFDKSCPIPKEIVELHNEAVDINLVTEN